MQLISDRLLHERGHDAWRSRYSLCLLSWLARIGFSAASEFPLPFPAPRTLLSLSDHHPVFFRLWPLQHNCDTLEFALFRGECITGRREKRFLASGPFQNIRFISKGFVVVEISDELTRIRGEGDPGCGASAGGPMMGCGAKTRMDGVASRGLCLREAPRGNIHRSSPSPSTLTFSTSHRPPVPATSGVIHGFSHTKPCARR